MFGMHHPNIDLDTNLNALAVNVGLNCQANWNRIEK